MQNTTGLLGQGGGGSPGAQLNALRVGDLEPKTMPKRLGLGPIIA